MSAIDFDRCVVCGNTHLEYPLEYGEICPCCGTEFGFNDQLKTHEQLRYEWIFKNRAAWWSLSTPPPVGWTPFTQLVTANYLPLSSDIPSSGIIDVKPFVVHSNLKTRLPKQLSTYLTPQMDKAV